MAYKATSYKELTIDVNGVQVTFTNVDFYPSMPATEIDPPESAMVTWDETFVGGVNIDGLVNLTRSFGESLSDELISFLED